MYSSARFSLWLTKGCLFPLDIAALAVTSRQTNEQGVITVYGRNA